LLCESQINLPIEEYNILAKLLKIPDLLGEISDSLLPISIEDCKNFSHHLVSPCPYQLAEFNPVFQELITKYRDFSCKICKTVPPASAICMLCGEFVCLVRKCCVDKNDRSEALQVISYCFFLFLLLLYSTL
jgi:hypothetical protein